MSRFWMHETTNSGSRPGARSASSTRAGRAAAGRTKAERPTAGYLTRGLWRGTLFFLGQTAFAMPLAGHHAVYKLALSGRAGSGDVIGLSGSMTYDIADLCSAWATAQHLSMTLSQANGKTVVTVSDYATLEQKDGSRFEFHTRQSNDGMLSESLDGTARAGRAGGGVAHFTSPESSDVALPANVKFPVAHTVSVLDAAMAGTRFSNVTLFDGTARDAEDTFVVTEGWGEGPASPRWPALRGLRSGIVHVSFFSHDDGSGGGTPDYEIGMRYYANGVADQLVMNFGDFSADGTLDRLEVHATPRCTTPVRGGAAP